MLSRLPFKDLVASGIPAFQVLRPLLRQGVMIEPGTRFPIECLPPRRLKLLYEQRYLEPITDQSDLSGEVAPISVLSTAGPQQDPSASDLLSTIPVNQLATGSGYQSKRKTKRK